MQTEVKDLLQWLMAPMSTGRGRKKRLRPISANLLKEFICQLAGYALNVKKNTVSSLAELITKERFDSYLKWCVEHRKVRPGPLASRCGVLYAALKKFPPLRGTDYSWMSDVIADLPSDPPRLRKEAKKHKWVDRGKLALIPQLIREEADRLYKSDPVRYAKAVGHQLLMSWITTLPWRQRNLRECKVMPYEQGGNLFCNAPQYSPL
jgi:hypothetical protein